MNPSCFIAHFCADCQETERTTRVWRVEIALVKNAIVPIWNRNADIVVFFSFSVIPPQILQNLGRWHLLMSYFESFQMKPCRQFNFKQPDCKIWESFPKFNSVSFHPVSNRTQGRRGEWVGERLCTRMVNLSLMNPAVRQAQAADYEVAGGGASYS